MSLLWFLVTDWEMGLFYWLQIMSFLWLWYPMRTMGLSLPAEDHESVVALGIRLWRSWGSVANASGVWWGWRYPTANNGLFYRLHIMSLLWLQVSACEQWGCLHLLHIMSLLWLQVCVCEHGVLLAAHWGPMRLEDLICDNGIVFTGCTLCVAVASGIRLEQRGCFQQLHIMSLLWLWYPTANCGCFQLLHIRSLMRLKVSDCEQGVVLSCCALGIAEVKMTTGRDCHCICGASRI